MGQVWTPMSKIAGQSLKTIMRVDVVAMGGGGVDVMTFNPSNGPM